MFDPDHPEKNFIIKNGAVEEVIEVEADAADEGNIPRAENEESVLGPQLEEEAPQAGVEADLHDEDQQEHPEEDLVPQQEEATMEPNGLEEDLMVNAEKRDREVVQQKAEEATLRTTLEQNQQMTTAAVRAATAAITEAKALLASLDRATKERTSKYNDAAIAVAQRNMFLNWRISQQDILDAAEEVLARARGDPEFTVWEVTRTPSMADTGVGALSLGGSVIP